MATALKQISALKPLSKQMKQELFISHQILSKHKRAHWSWARGRYAEVTGENAGNHKLQLQKPVVAEGVVGYRGRRNMVIVL